MTFSPQDSNSDAANVFANTNFTLSVATGTGSLTGTVTGTIPAGTSSTTVSGVIYNRAQTGVSFDRDGGTAATSLTAGTSTTFAVVTAALTIDANDDTKVYGDTKTYGTGQTAFTATGLKFSDTVGSVTITASGGTTAASNVGNFTP